MTPRIEIDKVTNVAYFDVSDPKDERQNAKVTMVSVSDRLGLRSEVLARLDVENNEVLGLVIEDYKAFTREIRMKYLAWRVEKLVELIFCSVRSIVGQENTPNRPRFLQPSGV
jgi:hypothetical protein